MLEESEILNIILWVGNLFMAGALFFYAAVRGIGCFAEVSGWRNGRRVDLFGMMDRILEFAVYSAGMIQLVDLIMQEIEISKEYSCMLVIVRILFAEGMLVLFLVLRMVSAGRKRAGNAESQGDAVSRGNTISHGNTISYGNTESQRNTVSDRNTESHRFQTILREEGESVLAMHLLLTLTLKGFQVTNPWKALGLQILLLAVLFTLLYLKKKRWERQSEDQQGAFVIRQQRQEDYFKNVDSQYQRTRELWHDLKNHIGVLEILAKEERFSELTDYLNSFKQDVEIRMIPTKTGNTAVDALLSDKLYHARKMNIEVSMQMSNLTEIMIPAMDICAVLGNLLDNAIEACEQFPGKGRIRLRMKRQENFYYLTVVNTATEPERAGTGFVSGKKGYDNGVGHGLGLRSVERIAHQYGGSLVTNYAEGEFKAVVRLQEKV